jgi:hypothetical protein
MPAKTMQPHATMLPAGVGQLDGRVMAPAPERAGGLAGVLAGRRGRQCAAPGLGKGRIGAQPRRRCRDLRKATWRPSRPPLTGGLPLRGLLRQLDDALLGASAEAVAVGVVASHWVIHTDGLVFDHHLMRADALAAKSLGLDRQFDLLAHLALLVVGCTAQPMTEEYRMMRHCARGILMLANPKRHNVRAETGPAAQGET